MYRKNLTFYVLPFFGLLLTGVTFTLNADAQKVRLRSQITPNCVNNRTTPRYKFADLYADGNIAVQGSYGCSGVFIYDISNPDAPVLASRYNPNDNQQFLEAVVIGNRGYFGSGNGGGVQIVDLTNPAAPVLLGTADGAHGNAFDRIHEIVIDGNLLYENYNSLNATKVIKVINISNPANPVFVRDILPTEKQWVHAMHIRGNRLFTSGWGNSTNRGRTEIYDISNIAAQAPTLLGYIEDANASPTNGNNMHSSWTSENGNYLYSCRETEDGQGDLRTYDIRNPAQPMLVNRQTMTDLGLNAVTPHNPVVKGNFLYVAWYQAGLQIFDISNPSTPVRVGQYDTYQQTFAPPEKSETLDKLKSEPWDFVCGAANLQNALPQEYDGQWAVFPFLGQNKILAGDLSNGLLILDASKILAPSKNVVSDFDGDGKTDFSAYTENNGNWKIETSSDNAQKVASFGAAGDKFVAGDYDGDGKSDIAVFRPSNGTWYVQGSAGGFRAVSFGLSSDVPVPADYDADGKTDVAVFRPSSGVWYILQSSLGFRAVSWGTSGDKPFAADFEGDGKPDFAVFRPSNSVWYILQSSSSIPLIFSWGTNGDKPLTADFNADGRSEAAVYRPTDGNWYVLNPVNNQLSVYNFGAAEDTPIPADYDGDGKADIAVYRPSVNAWYRLNSSNNSFNARIFGDGGDKPSPVSVQPQ